MFPNNFVWGCASSAYQIEGAVNEGGRKPSIWDTFCKQEGKIYEGHNADVACDFYHHYKEDIAIMKQMGVQAYRFSLSWSRILPDGIGKVNEEGIRFYKDVMDELIRNGIEPYITLYHWDFPQALQDKGGWLNEESIQWFAEYAAVVSRELSDRARYFITLNEPQCFTGIAHLHCDHAPGIKFDQKQMFQMIHNVLRAHGAATIALRENAKQEILVGYAPTCGMVYPKTETPENIEACRKYLFTCPDELNNWTWNVPWFSDPVFLGKYPEDGLKKYAEYLPTITDEDMALISQPLDFMGENIYNGIMLEADENGNPRYVNRYDGFPMTGNNWPITPECLRFGLRFLYERYKKPIFLTENGICCKDSISSDGKVHDPARIDFLNRYMLAMKKAMDEGVDLRGYFQWTLTDNFEWNFGYRDRFGLVYVDFRTQRRYRKDSSYWYAEVIRTNGGSLKAEATPIFLSKTKQGYVISEGEKKGETLTLAKEELQFVYDGGEAIAYEGDFPVLLENTDGYGTVNGLSICRGDCLLLTGDYEKIRIEGDMNLRVSQVEY